MRFSERFFRFPVKIYDGVSFRRILNKELSGEADENETPDWAQGDVKLPVDGLTEIYYYEGFSPGRKPEDVINEGFDITMVFHPSFGDFECLWPFKKFEQKLDEFVEKYEKIVEEEHSKHDSRSSTETK